MSKIQYKLKEENAIGRYFETSKGVIALVSIDDGKFHVSISHKGRLPTYKEIKEARYQLIPNDKLMVQIFPPKEEFVNIHENCLHLWEIENDTDSNL